MNRGNPRQSRQFGQTNSRPKPLPTQYGTITAQKLTFWRTNPRHVFYCGVNQIPLSWWFLEQMVLKIDARLEPANFFSYQSQTKPDKIVLDLRNYRKDNAGNEFIAANTLAVCVYETYKYLEARGMRNVPLPVFVVPLAVATTKNQLPKMVDVHNNFLDYFGLAVASYWRAKQQRFYRINPNRKVMERRLDMEIEATEVANFREIVLSSLNVTGWNSKTKLLKGADISAIYPNAEGMLSLGRARQVVVNLDDEDDEVDDDDDYIEVIEPTPVNPVIYEIKPEPTDFTTPQDRISLGMWGAL